MTRILRITAAVLAAVVVLVGVALPPARLSPATAVSDGTVPGVFHVHTNRSDGHGSPEAIAAIAADVGLKFVVFTDHGDATRTPDPPTYRSGVLCIDAVEISTEDGHLIALGLPEAPYPLAGEARDVLADVHRLGGIGIVAHPDSPRGELQWRDWDAPIDGVELLNLDSEWRAWAGGPDWRTGFRLLRSLATYAIRPSETIASMVGTGRGVDRRWRSLAERRRTPIFAGADAHARLALSGDDPRGSRLAFAIPGYATVFQTLTMRMQLAAPLSGDARSDGALLIDALRGGHGYATLDGILAPPVFSFSATSGGTTVEQGDDLIAAGPVSLTVTSNAPPTFTTHIWRDGELLYAQPSSPTVRVDGPAGAAVYRVEVRATHVPNAPAWILSNAIVVRPAPTSTDARVASATPPAGPARPLVGTQLWQTESSANAKVAVDDVGSTGGRDLLVRFGLPGGDVADQYAALAGRLDGGLGIHRRVTFTGRSDKPMRVSVQLRAPLGANGQRWRRSVYIDTEPRHFDLPFEDFRPVGGDLPAHPAPAAIDTLLFVVEQTNTQPGTSGRVWLSSIDLR